MSASRSKRPALRRLRIEPLEDRRLLAVFMVTNLNDAGDGSLRQAIFEANGNAEADTIEFAAVGTIKLTSGQLTITDSLTINGPGPERLTIDANNQSPVLNINDGTNSVLSVEINGLTITGGYGGNGGGIFSSENLSVTDSVISGNLSDDDGGGIFARAYDNNITVTVTDSTITGNTAGTSGGGISVDSFDLRFDVTVTVTGSTITGNIASFNGGGIHAVSEYRVVRATVTGSTISGNTAEERGGGIFAYSKYEDVSVTVTDSAVSGNTAGHSGGGILARAADNSAVVIVTGSTISGNTAERRGGGISAHGGDGDDDHVSVRVTGSTISGNTLSSHAGGIHSGGIFAYADGSKNVTVTGSILSGNSVAGPMPGDMVPGDVGGSFKFLVNHSLIGHAAAALVTFGSGTGNIITDDPQLAPLADNGGPTQTHALLPGSPAIDAGDPDFTPPPQFDQRGTPFARVVNGRIDIGAYEFSPSISADLTGNGFVDFEDLTVLLANWNQNVSAAQGNLVETGTTPVNFEDLTVLLAAWTGPGPAASPQPAATEAIIQRHPPTTQNHTATTSRFDQLGRRAYTRSHRIDPSTKPSSHDSPLRRLQAAGVDRALADHQADHMQRRDMISARRIRRGR